MAVAPLRRRAGRIEIDNRQSKIEAELREREANKPKEVVTQEEHEKRIALLKQIGVIK